MDRSMAPPWRLGDTVKGVVAVVLGGAGLLALAVSLERGGLTSGTAASLLAGGMLEALLLLAAWTFSVRRYRCSFETLGFRSVKGYHFWLIPLIAVVASLLAGGIYTLIVNGLGVYVLVPPDLSDSFENPHGLSRLGLAFVVVVMAPIAEETFFRGFLVQGLTPWAGPVGAAVGSSVLFSLSHGYIGALIPVFFSGLILAWVFMKTRSLTPGIFAHSIQNSLAFSLTF